MEHGTNSARVRISSPTRAVHATNVCTHGTERRFGQTYKPNGNCYASGICQAQQTKAVGEFVIYILWNSCPISLLVPSVKQGYLEGRGETLDTQNHIGLRCAFFVRCPFINKTGKLLKRYGNELTLRWQDILLSYIKSIKELQPDRRSLVHDFSYNSFC